MEKRKVLQLWFETRQNLNTAERKCEPSPDGRANIRKRVLPLEFLASDRNAKDAWISRWAERPGGSVQLKKTSKMWRCRTWDDILTDRSNLVLDSVRHRKLVQASQKKKANMFTLGCSAKKTGCTVHDPLKFVSEESLFRKCMLVVSHIKSLARECEWF